MFRYRLLVQKDFILRKENLTTTSILTPFPRGWNPLRFTVFRDRTAGNTDPHLFELAHNSYITERAVLVLLSDEVLDSLDDATPGLHITSGLGRTTGKE